MKLPSIQGVIERRLLVNYRVDPDRLRRLLPAPFRPQLVNGFGIAGICLIRLARIRPAFLPAWLGLTSENAAHRFAVEYDENGTTRCGVYIPRRDTSSWINGFAGGRLFPGRHHVSEIMASADNGRMAIDVLSRQDNLRIHVAGHVASQFPATSVFTSVAGASSFFEQGSLGFSPSGTTGVCDALSLCCRDWTVRPFEVEQLESSFFDDRKLFPPASIEFDCALFMSQVEHHWRVEQTREVGVPEVAAWTGV